MNASFTRVCSSITDSGTIVGIVSDEFKGYRSLVSVDEGAGIIQISGSDVPCLKIDEYFVIATENMDL
jgi:hypothetical protein